MKKKGLITLAVAVVGLFVLYKYAWPPFHSYAITKGWLSAPAQPNVSSGQ
jgi:hypothetical protein